MKLCRFVKCLCRNYFSYIIIIMSKHQKDRVAKVAKKSSHSVSALQQNLFQQLQSINNKTEYCQNPDLLFAEFEEYEDSNKEVYEPKMGLLSKAKQLVCFVAFRLTRTRAKSRG